MKHRDQKEIENRAKEIVWYFVLGAIIIGGAAFKTDVRLGVAWIGACSILAAAIDEFKS